MIAAEEMKRPGYTNSRNNRPTIGLLTYSQPDTLSIEIWSGLVDFSRERDANLICFPGESWHDPTEFRWQANVLYDLVSAENVDGLVVWGGALEAFDRAGLSARCRRYHPLPMVSIGTSPPGIPGVLVDSYQGMRQAITHLVEVHGYRRIAFICGPQGQSETEARYRAYCDVLAEHGLPFDEQLVARCNLQPQVGAEGVRRPPWQMQVGPEAIRLLVDERHADFEALVGVGDSVILIAMEELRARGIHIPGDVAVVGFDDIEDSRYAQPPLTTVSFRAYEQGYRAAEMLWALIEGQPVPERTVLPVRLTVRQSCGCMDQTVIQAAARPAARFPLEMRGETCESALALQRTDKRSDILSAMTEAVTLPAPGLEPRWAERLLDSFLADLRDPGSSTFLHTLDGVLRQVATAGGDVSAWQGMLSALRSHALPCLSGGQVLSRAEDLWQQARVVIGEVAEQARAYWNLRAEKENRLLGETGQVLITTFDVTELMRVVARELPRLGLKRGYVALYENPRAPEEWARLLLAYDEEGCLELDAAGRRFPSRQLVPEDLQARDRRCCCVVEPLYFREEQLGFAVLEAEPSQMGICYALRGQLSSALKGALLFRQSVEAQIAAQKADQLKTRLLANVSHELRTPLNTIMDFARLAEDSPDVDSAALSPAVLKDLRHIYDNAEHLLRVINDLLDLSRAEIDELDLYPEMIDTRPFLEQVFHSIADAAVSAGQVAWRLALPERLPMLQADPLRMRQILLNLLNNAQKFTDAGEIVLGAEVAPPSLHVWVQDTGAGIPADQQERIFEPFVTADRADRRPEGIGLGLSVTRRLVALHHGSMRLESQPGQGSVFHVYLPLPSLSDQPAASLAPTQPVLLLLSTQERAAPEIVELCQRQGWEIRRAQTRDDVGSLLRTAQPAMLAWDMAGAGSSATPGSWTIIQHLRQDPRMSRVPFIFYGQPAHNAASIPAGMVNLVTKPARADTLSQALNALRPPGSGGPILIVDDDPQARQLHQGIVSGALPGYPIRSAEDGRAALDSMLEQVPSLVILDLIMPEMDGFDVLDWMRANPDTRQVPVLILSGRTLTFDDVQRLEQHALVTFHSKEVLSEEETAAAVHRTLFDGGTLPPYTSALVKRAIAYLHQNYDRPLSRGEIAQAIGASEDYLSRIFRQELGLSPWDYLHRYRIKQAKELLTRTNASVMDVALQVGFNDRSYFSRVFRELVGTSPGEYRKLATLPQQAGKPAPQVTRQAGKPALQVTNVREGEP